MTLVGVMDDEFDVICLEVIFVALHPGNLAVGHLIARPKARGQGGACHAT
jgi:hypothetical protein